MMGEQAVHDERISNEAMQSFVFLPPKQQASGGTLARRPGRFAKRGKSRARARAGQQRGKAGRRSSLQ